MTYADIINKVAEENGIPNEIVSKAYKAFWLFIRKSIQDLPLKDSLTEEEFNKLRTSFNIPSLGKLSCTYSRYTGVKDRFNYIIKFREKNEKTNRSKASVQ